MSEKLIPFDFEAFKADPSRLRTDTEMSAEWAAVAHGYLVVMWPCNANPVVYSPPHFAHHLRLAAKTRIVKVRLIKTNGGDVFARTSDGTDVTGLNYCGHPWASDIIEVEVTE